MATEAPAVMPLPFVQPPSVGLESAQLVSLVTILRLSRFRFSPLSVVVEPLLVFLLPLLNPITRSPFAAAFRSFFLYLDSLAVTIAAPLPRVLASTHFDCTILLGRRWGAVPSHLISLTLLLFTAIVLGRPAFSFSADTDWYRCRTILTNFGLITILYSNRAGTERRTNVKGILHLMSFMLISDVLRFVFFVHFFLCVIYRLAMAISAYHVLVEGHAAAVAAEDPDGAARAAGD